MEVDIVFRIGKHSVLMIQRETIDPVLIELLKREQRNYAISHSGHGQNKLHQKVYVFSLPFNLMSIMYIRTTVR